MRVASLVVRLWLPALTWMACNPAANGGGGGGGGTTTFKGVASGIPSLSIVEFKVGTMTFSPPAPSLSPTEVSLSSTVTATGTMTSHPGGQVTNLAGTWDEGTNTLYLESNSGTTMDGSYIVQTNQIGGVITYSNGTSKHWSALKGGNGTTYCGTWNTGGIYSDLYGFVVSGPILRGYGDAQLHPVDGTVSGNSIQFDYMGFSGTGTISASGVTGTVNGIAFTGAVCG